MAIFLPMPHPPPPYHHDIFPDTSEEARHVRGSETRKDFFFLPFRRKTRFRSSFARAEQMQMELCINLHTVRGRDELFRGYKRQARRQRKKENRACENWWASAKGAQKDRTVNEAPFSWKQNAKTKVAIFLAEVSGSHWRGHFLHLRAGNRALGGLSSHVWVSFIFVLFAESRGKRTASSTPRWKSSTC